ncbi:hypothetical protein JEO77_20985 [Aeromonas veronii]|uniref:hypothetical protein n=1 Tax=Aeromonas veronii TaxID=654 RepID=UPI00191E40A0|nr:hypothetical protein [Aeromonas veronii]MBL0443848.1 hypothetical protein [Aeromonas veronii]
MEHRPIKKTTRGISLGDSRLGLPEGIIRYAFLLISQSLRLNATINSNNSNSPKLFPDFFFLASLDLGFTLGRAHSFVADSSMQESRSAKDVEQLLGRVLRMPYAKARKHPELNQAYAHITARSFGEALHSIQDNLVNNMGFDPMDAALALQSQPAGNNSLFNDESDGSGGTAPSQPSMSVPLPVMPQTPVPAELQDKIEIRPTQSGSTVLIHGEMTQEVEDFILTGVPKKHQAMVQQRMEQEKARHDAQTSPSARGVLFRQLPLLCWRDNGFASLADAELFEEFSREFR